MVGPDGVTSGNEIVVRVARWRAAWTAEVGSYRYPRGGGTSATPSCRWAEPDLKRFRYESTTGRPIVVRRTTSPKPFSNG
jgi:hypothetical protein